MPAAGPPRPALFLDRDGVINVDRNYVYRTEDFEWIEGAVETIKAFNARGWWVFIVTNQSGIARGYYTEEQMEALHAWLNDELAERGARLVLRGLCGELRTGRCAERRLDDAV